MPFYTRSCLRIDTVRDALARRGDGLAGEFHLNENNKLDRPHIAGMLRTFDEAAADRQKFRSLAALSSCARAAGHGAVSCRQKFRSLAALSRVHEAPSSPREFARMRDMVSNGLYGEYLSQTVAGRAAMPPSHSRQTCGGVPCRRRWPGGPPCRPSAMPRRP